MSFTLVDSVVNCVIEFTVSAIVKFSDIKYSHIKGVTIPSRNFTTPNLNSMHEIRALSTLPGTIGTLPVPVHLAALGSHFHGAHSESDFFLCSMTSSEYSILHIDSLRIIVSGLYSPLRLSNAPSYADTYFSIHSSVDI